MSATVKDVEVLMGPVRPPPGCVRVQPGLVPLVQTESN